MEGRGGDDDLMLLLKGQTVTIVRRTLVVDGDDKPVPDAYGNDQFTTTTFTVDGCAISPGFSSEEVEGTESTTDNVNVHMPNGTVVYAIDQVILPDDFTYEVTGSPNTWESPFTGTLGPVEVKLKRVTSGSGVR